MARTRIPITDWLEPGKLTLLQGWARDGLTDAQIAQKIGISIRTLANWKKYSTVKDGREVRPILKALKDGKEVVDIAVENALLKSALEGNTTAMIFWLKNRRPDKWRDRQKETGPETEIEIEDLSGIWGMINEEDADDPVDAAEPEA